MIQNKGIDNVVSVFSVIFISLFSFYFIASYPKTHHEITMCSLNSCTFIPAETFVLTETNTQLQNNTSPVVEVTPIPAYMDLKPEVASITPPPTVTSSPIPPITETPHMLSTPSEKPHEPHQAELISNVIIPVTQLVATSKNILR